MCAQAHFSNSAFTLYRYVYCGIPTGGCRQNRGKRNGQACSLQWCAAKLSTALALREAHTVSSALSIPGKRKKCVGISLNAPLKPIWSIGMTFWSGQRVVYKLKCIS